MKRHIKRVATALVTLGGLGMVSTATADTTITPFDNFTENALYGSWSSATITRTGTNIIITATGYGSNWKYLGTPINAAGETNIQLDVTLAGPPGANGQLGPIIDLVDTDGTYYSYRWYGQTLGNHILNMPINLPTAVVAAGSTPGLNIAAIEHMHMELDPGGFGSSGAYTISWNDLKLTGVPAPPNGVCATVSSFDNYNLGGTYGGWSSATINSTPTNYQVTASGFGGGFAGISPTISTDGTKILRLDVTLSGAGLGSQLGPIVILEDGDGTQLRYAWYGQTPGNHVLTAALNSGVVAQAGSTPGFDFSTISFMHLQIDNGGFGGTYTAAWNNLDITGCAAVPQMQITGQSYNPSTHEMTLTWSSSSGQFYTIENTTSLATPMSPLVTGIPSQGTSTTTTVILPNADAGFIRVKQE